MPRLRFSMEPSALSRVRVARKGRRRASLGLLVLCAAIMVSGASSGSVAAGPDLRVHLLPGSGPNPATLGGQFYLELRVSNTGTRSASFPRLVVDLPKQLRARTSVVAAAGGNCSGTRRIVCRLAPIDPCAQGCNSEPVQVSIATHVLEKGRGLIRFRASATANGKRPDSRGTIRLRVRNRHPLADLSVSIAPGQGFQAGVPTPLLFTLRNHGPTDAVEVGVTIRITSAGRWFRAGGAPFRECHALDDSGTYARCSVNFLQSGRSVQLKAIAYLQQGPVGFVARVVSPTKDPRARNDTATLDTVAPPPARTTDLGVEIDGPTTANVDTDATYIATITNHGPDTAREAAIGFLLLPEGDGEVKLHVVSLLPTHGTCSESAICAIGELQPGGSVRVALTVRYLAAQHVRWIVAGKGDEDAFDPGRYQVSVAGYPNNASVVTDVESPSP
jgi:Domain of unknown function DUF11